MEGDENKKIEKESLERKDRKRQRGKERDRDEQRRAGVKSGKREMGKEKQTHGKKKVMNMGLWTEVQMITIIKKKRPPKTIFKKLFFNSIRNNGNQHRENLRLIFK